MAYTAQEWSVSALSVELGMDRRTLGKKMEGVLPVRTAGKTKYFRMADVVRAVFAGDTGGGSLEEERTRLTKAQADKTELEVSQLRASLIPMELVLATWQSLIAAARAKFLSMPTKMAHTVIAATDLSEVEEAIKSQVYEAMAELDTDGLPDSVRSLLETDHQRVEAATESDGESVGGSVPKAKRRKRSRARTVAH